MFTFIAAILLMSAILALTLRGFGVKHYFAISTSFFAVATVAAYFALDYLIRSRPYP